MGRNKGHIPIRTCISCGRKCSKYDLVRLLPGHNGCLVKDNSGKLQGRSFYVCNTIECQDRLKGNKRLNRLLNTDGKIIISPL